MGRSIEIFKSQDQNGNIQASLAMNHCFWTELSVTHSTLCGLALAILVL